MKRTYQTTTWLNKKVLIGHGDLDSARPVNILLGFHGAESTPENLLVHGNKLEIPNSITIYPEGPVDAGRGLWSWWRDGPRQKEAVGQFVDFTGALLDEAEAYARQAAPSATARYCLWGFSQGGAASLVYTLLGRHPVHKAASICGFLPELPDDSPHNPHKVNVFGIFGMNDDVVPSFLADHALDEVKNQGHPTTAKETNQAHEINMENLCDLTAFFNSP